MTGEMLRQFAALLRPLKTKIANSIAMAVVENVDDSTKAQMLQLSILDGEAVDDCQRVQQFGFSSVPLEGAEAVVLFPNGDRGNPLVVAVDDRRHRPTGWTAGEAGTFNAFSAQMRHKADGTTEVTGGGVAAALATKADIQRLLDVLTAWVPVATDGGLKLKNDLIAEYGAVYLAAGTAKLKAE